MRLLDAKKSENAGTKQAVSHQSASILLSGGSPRKYYSHIGYLPNMAEIDTEKALAPQAVDKSSYSPCGSSP